MADEPTPTPEPTPAPSPSPTPTPTPSPTPAPAPAPTPAPTDWRASVQDEKLREHAGRFTSLDDLVKANLDSRQKLSTAVVIPGKDAKPEEMADFRKKIGVPEKADEYLKAFPQPEAGTELPPETLANRNKWAERLHAANVPAEAAPSLIKGVIEDTMAEQAAIKAADEKFAKESEDALRKEWGGEFEQNKTYATRAAKELLGADFDTARQIEDKTGRFVLDNPIFAKMLAKIGREMGESRIGAVVSETDRNSMNDQIRTLRNQQAEAQSKGDNRRANELYQQEQAIIAKLNGTQAVVGARGRAA